jgi:hypothetical protein
MKGNFNNICEYLSYLHGYGYPGTNYTGLIPNEMEVNHDIGYLELFVFTDRGATPVERATITIYARQGEVNEVPVEKIISTKDPVTVALPVAHPKGSLIEGPEYYYTTYNMTIEKPDYYAITVKNIRIFPGVTAKFSYHLNRVLPGVPGRQETIAIPSHPRDVV